MRLGNFRLDIDYDRLFYPYYMFRRYPSDDIAKYYGHRWFLLVHILWWEVCLLELC